MRIKTTLHFIVERKIRNMIIAHKADIVKKCRILYFLSAYKCRSHESHIRHYSDNYPREQEGSHSLQHRLYQPLMR